MIWSQEGVVIEVVSDNKSDSVSESDACDMALY
jgi:hypothetical protein